MVDLSPPKPVKAEISEPARVIGTTYQNTTGRPKLIMVAVLCDRADEANGKAYIGWYVGPASPLQAADKEGDVGFYLKHNIPDIGFFQGVFAVPPGYYYKVDEFISLTSSITIDKWFEVEL